MENQKTRNDEIRNLRSKGLSYGTITKLINSKYNLSLSRQRIHQISSGYLSPSGNKWVSILISSIKKRDDYCCQWAKLCDGKKKDASDLVVHHIDFDDRNNAPSNLITLCTSCHASFHSQYHIDAKIEKNLGKGLPSQEKIKIKCKFCGKDFYVTNARKEALYCNSACFNKGRLKLTKKESLKMYYDVKGGLTLQKASEEYGITWVTVQRIVQYRVPEWFGVPKLNLLERYFNRGK